MPFQKAPDRQPRRDRHSYRARRRRDRPCHRRDLPRRRRAVAACPRGRCGPRNPGAGRAGLSRYRSRHCRRQGDRMRCAASRLWLSQRECRAGAALRGRGDHLRRAFAGGARSVRRQGQGQGAGEGHCGVPIIEGTSGPTTLEQAKAFFASLGAGGAVMIKAIAGGGGRGMRIVDDADKARRGLCALPVRGEGRLRQRRRLCRAPDPQRPPYRGADHRRPPWRDQPFVGARMHHPAAEPEADRGGAEPVAERRPCARASSRPPRSSPPPRTTTISAPSNSWSMAMPGATTRPSPSSRPIRGFRSSTP